MTTQPINPLWQGREVKEDAKALSTSDVEAPAA
jgi:hypothetical protein